MHLDPKTRGRTTDEALEIIARLWSGEKFDFAGKHFQLTGAQIAPLPVQPDLPMWIGGSSEAAVRRTAKYGTGWQAGAETPETVAQMIADIKTATAAAGRSIDDDHYGAAFAFRFGGLDDPGVAKVLDQYKARTGRDGRDYFAVGGADEIMERLTAYVEAGASKFILRPAADGDMDMLAQTTLLVEEVLPRVAAKWPKPPKAA